MVTYSAFWAPISANMLGKLCFYLLCTMSTNSAQNTLKTVCLLTVHYDKWMVAKRHNNICVCILFILSRNSGQNALNGLCLFKVRFRQQWRLTWPVILEFLYSAIWAILVVKRHCMLLFFLYCISNDHPTVQNVHHWSSFCTFADHGFLSWTLHVALKRPANLRFNSYNQATIN